ARSATLRQGATRSSYKGFAEGQGPADRDPHGGRRPEPPGAPSGCGSQSSHPPFAGLSRRSPVVTFAEILRPDRPPRGPRQPPAPSAMAMAPTAPCVSAPPAAIARRDTPLLASATSVIHSAVATARWAPCPPAGAPLTATYAPTPAVPASSARAAPASTLSARPATAEPKTRSAAATISTAASATSVRCAYCNATRPADALPVAQIGQPGQ